MYILLLSYSTGSDSFSSGLIQKTPNRTFHHQPPLTPNPSHMWMNCRSTFPRQVIVVQLVCSENSLQTSMWHWDPQQQIPNLPSLPFRLHAPALIQSLTHSNIFIEEWLGAWSNDKPNQMGTKKGTACVSLGWEVMSNLWEVTHSPVWLKYWAPKKGLSLGNKLENREELVDLLKKFQNYLKPKERFCLFLLLLF